MTQKLFLLSVLALFFMVTASIAYAQVPSITFPIAELGGCTTKEECKTYCDGPAHIEACLSFAEAHGLMTKSDASTARTLLGQRGPGGCSGTECRTYCSDTTHRDECIAFAREHGLSTPPSRAEVESKLKERTDFKPDVHEPSIDEDRAMQIVKENGGPGGCSTKEECQTYCDVPGNMEVCFAFAEEHNLMSQEDLERARKMLAQEGPGGCKGLQCRTYCENPEYAEECLAFAEEQGFIAPEEADRARKLMSTTGPGGCRGIECKNYCENPAYQKECLAFAVEHDLIPKEEAERINEFMERGGPGGCKSEEECFTYCNQNPKECFSFGSQSGEVSDFGQEHVIDERGFEIPQGTSCTTPEECRALYEKNATVPHTFIEGESQYGTEGIQQYEQQFEQQFEQEYQRQYQEQYQQQYQEQYQQQLEQSGTEYQQQYQQYQEQYQQPSGTREYEYTQPPSSEPLPPTETAPTSWNRTSNFIATVFFAIEQLLGL